MDNWSVVWEMGLIMFHAGCCLLYLCLLSPILAIIESHFLCWWLDFLRLVFFLSVLKEINVGKEPANCHVISDKMRCMDISWLSFLSCHPWALSYIFCRTSGRVENAFVFIYSMCRYAEQVPGGQLTRSSTPVSTQIFWSGLEWN